MNRRVLSGSVARTKWQLRREAEAEAVAEVEAVVPVEADVAREAEVTVGWRQLRRRLRKRTLRSSEI